jgi:uncharacterized protein
VTELGLYSASMGPLLVSLVDRVPGASHAVLSSVEGVPVATSSGLPEQRAEQLAAIGAGLLSIADGAGRALEVGDTCQAVVEMAAGILMATPVAAGLSLTIVAVVDCDREELGFEAAQFIDQVKELLR